MDAPHTQTYVHIHAYMLAPQSRQEVKLGQPSGSNRAKRPLVLCTRRSPQSAGPVEAVVAVHDPLS